jgi:predicted NAD/FAD-binding protein
MGQEVKPRIAVIGGGIGGITTAYLLEGECDVEIFEARSKVGGHCDSRILEYQGQKITVDLGAQFFHPATHPLYVTLLEELGIYDPDDRDNDQTLDAPGSLCMFNLTNIWPVFSSSYPLLTPFVSIDFATYVREARQVILQDQSWEITLDQWIMGLPVSKRFKNKCLYPWISAAIGCTRADAARSLARSILQSFALAFPENPSEKVTTMNSKLGTGGNLQRALDCSPSTRIHVDTPIESLTFTTEGWTLRSPSGFHGPFDAVVMNAPPSQSKHLLKPLEWASDLVPLLEKYEYFDARILIHSDAKYAYRGKRLWAVYNGGIDGMECEGSVWYGGIQPKLPSGARINVFKSFATRRRHDPENILCERLFQHPLITPDVVRASRALNTFQGRNNLYFVGNHTTGMDLQEAAVYSALKVADALSPSSSALAALQKRLARRGRGGISYDP